MPSLASWLKGGRSTRSAAIPPDRLIAFYDPNLLGTDSSGRTLNDLLQVSYEYLEDKHDFIQWMFPLPEGSIYADAPVVNKEVMEAFHSRAELRDQLKRSFIVICGFYGFDAKYPPQDTPSSTADDTPSSDDKQHLTLVRSEIWRDCFRNWTRKRNHNHLRISRIIRSLRILGLEDEAMAFFTAVIDACEEPDARVDEKAIGFWAHAATEPLHKAPDGSVVSWLAPADGMEE